MPQLTPKYKNKLLLKTVIENLAGIISVKVLKISTE